MKMRIQKTVLKKMIKMNRLKIIVIYKVFFIEKCYYLFCF